MFHILYDGTVVDEDRFTALGGEADAISSRMARAYRPGWSLSEALAASVQALSGEERGLQPQELEVAVLDRSNGRRAFRRILEPEIRALLGRGPGGERADEAGGAAPGSPEPGGASEDVGTAREAEAEES